MVFFTLTSLLAASAAFAGVTALPTAEAPSDAIVARSGTQSGTGTNGGYYYSFYTDNNADVIYTNQNGGAYEVQWDGNGDFVAGKGWSTGSARTITYSASVGASSDSNWYLSVYGWFTNPLVEYYILEDYGSYNPSSGLTYKGTVTSDGSVYNIYEGTRTNAPSIQGTATFHQYWSIRQNKRTSGTITTANHFNAWRSLGLPTGTFNEQIVALEGESGSGQATVTV